MAEGEVVAVVDLAVAGVEDSEEEEEAVEDVDSEVGSFVSIVQMFVIFFKNSLS